MDRKLQKIILKLLIFTLPFQPVLILEERFLNGEKWQFGTLVLYGGEILILIATGLWLYSAWKDKKINFKKTKSAWVYVLSLFIFYSYLSALWSAYPDLAWQKSRFLVEALLVFFLISRGHLSKKEIIDCFIPGLLVSALLGIHQFIAQSSFSYKWLGIAQFNPWQTGAPVLVNSTGRWLRAYGSFLNPNIFGGYLALSLLFLTEMNTKIISKKEIIKTCLSLTIITLGLFFSFSRSAWLTAFITIFFIAARSFLKKNFESGKKALFITLLFIVLSLIYNPLVSPRFQTTSYTEKKSLNERTEGYRQSYSIIKKHSLLGVGAGNYTAANQNDSPVHNVFLLFLAEYGLAGVFLLALLLCSLLKAYPLNIPAFLIPLPILLLDHYLLSSWAGLLALSLYAALLIHPPHSIPSQSTISAQKGQF